MSAETPDQNQSQAVETALCNSVLSKALSLAFYHPTSDSFAALVSKKTREAVSQASSLLVEHSLENGKGSTDSPERDYPLELFKLTETWAGTLSSLNLSSLQSTHGRLFGHTAQGTVSPYETEYGQDGLFQQPQQLASLVGFYLAFGLTVRRNERERPDHLSCELEFLECLLSKEAYALEKGDDPMLAATRRAIHLFLKEHLGRFGRAFGRGLKRHDSEGFLGKSGDLLFDFLTLQCRRLGIEAGPSQLPLRSTEEDQVPMACGGETELVQLET